MIDTRLQLANKIDNTRGVCWYATPETATRRSNYNLINNLLGELNTNLLPQHMCLDLEFYQFYTRIRQKHVPLSH